MCEKLQKYQIWSLFEKLWAPACLLSKNYSCPPKILFFLAPNFF